VPVFDGSTRPGVMLEALLKAPERVTDAIGKDRASVRTGWFFLIGALLFHAVFGAAMGLFGGAEAGLASAFKAPLVGLFALVLCFPSLYVFSSVGGAPLSLRQTFLTATSCLAMIGLLLVGLAPVAWLFAVSTASLRFMMILVLVAWGIAVWFARRYLNGIRLIPEFQQSGGISCWFLVFVVVSLQMATCLRPMLTAPTPERGWLTSEKKFFMAHFSDCWERGK